MSARRLQYRNRWFCYLDLLGFKNLVRSDELGHVIPLYDEVLEILERGASDKKSLGLSYSWFSDTFIIFSRGDSLRDFTLVEQAGRLFFQRLILAEIPVRGAITHGRLYSNLKRNIFLGDALIDGYEYGEKQRWLALILTPHVYAKLEDGQLDVRRRWNYQRVSTPGIITHPEAQNIFAFTFNNGSINGENPYVDALRRMRTKAGPAFQDKYENTENFIHECARARTVATAP